jgi:Protein of unknown function (DUF3017)
VTTQPVVPGGPVRRPFGELPTAVVVLIAGFGMVAVTLGHWRRGMFLVGVAALVAALLRLVLRSRDAGLLVIRGRVFDVVALVLIGGTVLVLTAVVPGTSTG